MGNREVGCLRKGWLVGAPVVPLGHPRLAMFLESMAFFKGPASMEALCGMHGGVLSLWVGKREGEWICPVLVLA